MHTVKLASIWHGWQVFEMKDGGTTVDDSTALVRVRNTQTKLVCMWPLTKLKERLVKMRKLMYAVSDVIK